MTSLLNPGRASNIRYDWADVESGIVTTHKYPIGGRAEVVSVALMGRAMAVNRRSLFLRVRVSKAERFLVRQTGRSGR